jgi:hypothetical protein
MGSINSGRWLRFDTRRTVEACPGLDIRVWNRWGYLVAGQKFQWTWTRRGEAAGGIWVVMEAEIALLYFRPSSNDGQEICQRVSISASNCTYGGERRWFLCPSEGCEHRVAWLYYWSHIFACRHCHRLSYASRNQAKWDRFTYSAEKIRMKLGWTPSILDDTGLKPKWMRWRTFYRLEAQESELRLQALQSAAAHFTR